MDKKPKEEALTNAVKEHYEVWDLNYFFNAFAGETKEEFNERLKKEAFKKELDNKTEDLLKS